MSLILTECPRDWVEFKGTVSCYKFQRYPLMNFNDARTRCAVSSEKQIFRNIFYLILTTWDNKD